MIPTKMREAVARAMWAKNCAIVWEDETEALREDWRAFADAALSIAIPMIVERCAKVAEEAASDASDADNEYDGGAGRCGYRIACDAIAKSLRNLTQELPDGKA